MFRDDESLPGDQRVPEEVRGRKKFVVAGTGRHGFAEPLEKHEGDSRHGRFVPLPVECCCIDVVKDLAG